MKNVKPFTLVLLLGALLLVGGTVTGQERGIAGSEDQELVVSITPSEIVFDPHHAYSASEAQLFTAIYEGLVTYDPRTLEPIPAAAQSWTVSPNGRVYTFTIRESARFWDGRPVRAQDFRNSWLRLIDPSERAEYASLFDIIQGAEAFRTGRSADPESVGIRALSSTQLQVTLEEPAAHFLKILCHHSFVPIHPLMLSGGDWNNLTEVPGSGPYYVASRNEREMVLLRNELYWDRANIVLPKIRYVMIEDPNMVSQMFNKGQIDWIAGDFSFELINNMDTLVYAPMFATQYFYFSLREESWKDSRVRKALALLVPWDEVRRNAAIPASTLVPPIPGYPQVQGVVSGSDDEAMKLLAEAGYPEGRGLPTLTFLLPAGAEEIRRMAAVMASVWKEKLDLEISISQVPYEQYFARVNTDPFTIATLIWIGDFADPLTFLQLWTGSSNLNNAGFTDEEFDRLVKRSMGQRGEERYATLADAERRLLDGAAVLPISHTPSVNMIDTEIIDGWYPNPLDIHPFKFMKFAEFTPIPGIVLAPGPNGAGG
jgi:oligopeptide transport system substrate-binding protein